MSMFCSIARNESDLAYFSKDFPSGNSKTVLLRKPKQLWVPRLALPTLVHLVQLRSLYSLDLTELFLNTPVTIWNEENEYASASWQKKNTKLVSIGCFAKRRTYLKKLRLTFAATSLHLKCDKNLLNKINKGRPIACERVTTSWFFSVPRYCLK